MRSISNENLYYTIEILLYLKIAFVSEDILKNEIILDKNDFFKSIFSCSVFIQF